MLAMNYRGPKRVRVSEKPLPTIKHPEDAIVRVTRSCICGSDLHLYNGNVPDTRVGMTFGHEFTGVVVEVGTDVTKVKVGDHVIVPFNVACGKWLRPGAASSATRTRPAATRAGRPNMRACPTPTSAPR
jgi:threonine dehydrogenase-like Zn-dependent dehydrogenase